MRIFTLIFLFFVTWAGAVYAERSFDTYGIAVLQGLDKPNARVRTFEVPVGKTEKFGPLNVLVRACKKTPPEDTPEAVTFLEISDTRIKDSDKAALFKGWMFASSPALSAMEHATYDVWVLDCKNPATSEPAAADDTSPASAKKAAPDKAKRKR